MKKINIKEAEVSKFYLMYIDYDYARLLFIFMLREPLLINGSFISIPRMEYQTWARIGEKVPVINMTIHEKGIHTEGDINLNNPSHTMYELDENEIQDLIVRRI